MKKLKLKENEVVHCATLKQAKKALKIAHELGYKWNDNTLLIDYVNFKNELYYVFRKDKSVVQTKHKEERKTITSKEFIKRHKKASLKKRIKALEAIANATNDSKNGWYKWKDTNYLMYHDFESNNKFGFGVNGEWYSKFKALGDLTAYTKKATYEEIKQRLIEEATKRGFNINCEINCKNGQNFPAILNEFEYVEEENKLLYSGIEIMKDGVWESCKPYEKEIEQPQIGDVVKAWDDDKSKFVYGVLFKIDESAKWRYFVGQNWKKNIEKVTEISINDFKK